MWYNNIMNKLSKIYDININNEVHKVEIQKKKIKRINIRVSQINEIKVSCPLNCTYDDALSKVYQHRDWVEKTMSCQNKNIETLAIRQWMRDEVIYLEGHCYNLIQDNSLNEVFLIRNQDVFIKGDPKKAIDKIRQSLYYKITEEFNLCHHSFQPYIIQKPFLEIKKMKSRWGSCNYKTGRIVINKMLVHVAPELLHYVMMHEFTHLIFPNHSKQFRDFLKKCVPNSRDYEKQLKQFSFLLLT